MCGIAGAFNYLSREPVGRETIERMTRIMAHRGPDAEGYYLDQELALGHRRLSILDLSERGRNPMFSSDGRYCIVYNGEVYNYIELRNELLESGVTFRTDTDTEVVLELYARKGTRSLESLNGMFAFAIWDTVERSLFLARDRVGIKPLYYAETPDGVVFASEAKALFLFPGMSCEVDAARVDVYLTFGYTPGECTAFKGVRKLLPGWAMKVASGGVRRWRYWDVEFHPATGRSTSQTADELRWLLTDAVKLHMRSDVPVGVFLSGGLDSSAVVSLLAHAGFEGVRTFSVAYRNGERYDETRYAKIVADACGTDHHVLFVDPSQFGAFIPDYVWYMDEPVAEGAAISLCFVAKLLGEHVTVALSGEGSDELFAGYQIYRYMQWLEQYRKLPEWSRRAVIDPLLARLPSARLAKYTRLAAMPLAQRYRGVPLYDSLNADLYADGFRAAIGLEGGSALLSSHYTRVQEHDPLSQMLYVDFKTWLVDDLLIKADKMTMANSVELRVPFLDHRVVEYAATIPSSMKLRGGSVKWILKRALGRLLPREILTRKKAGFPTPLAEMFRGELGGYVDDLLRSSRSLQRGYFRPEAVLTLLDRHREGRADAHDALWRLVVLEEWHRRFIDRSASGWPLDQPVVPAAAEAGA